jgi:phospholipase C
LTDVANGNLANVSFIMPYNGKVSDHPVHVKDPTAGPTWVASIINAIGETPFWNDTAIVVYWDDWGGFFDHVAPPTGPLYQDPFEYGFRVPLVLIAPYAKVGTIDHTARTFVGSLRLIEETFGLPSLGTLDQYEPDALDSMLDFTQSPLPFTPLGGSSARPFQHIPIRSHATPKR